MSLFHNEHEEREEQLERRENLLLLEILHTERDVLQVMRRILHALESHHYTVRVTQEISMSIEAGKSGNFQATLEDNGAAIALPSGSTFAWSTDLPDATVTPSADTLTAEIAIPLTATATSIVVTAATTDPNGSAVSGAVTVEVTPGHVFTVSVVQV